MHPEESLRALLDGFLFLVSRFWFIWEVGRQGWSECWYMLALPKCRRVTRKTA